MGRFLFQFTDLVFLLSPEWENKIGESLQPARRRTRTISWLYLVMEEESMV